MLPITSMHRPALLQALLHPQLLLLPVSPVREVRRWALLLQLCWGAHGHSHHWARPTMALPLPARHQ